MLNGLDLFSGIGGISLALDEWVEPAAYCENDRYAQSVLLSRMHDGFLPTAPIWDDVRTLKASQFTERIDIITGGFPCQDISCAGLGKGLAGERSGLFREIARLTRELRPTFVFLENVPAIRKRGLNEVARTFTELGYDMRWTTLSAASVGAPHLRKRWFMLAHTNGESRSGEIKSRQNVEFDVCESSQFCNGQRQARPKVENVPDTHGKQTREQHGRRIGPDGQGEAESRSDGGERPMANAAGERERESPDEANALAAYGQAWDESVDCGWWSAEPDVGRVAYGVQARVDRLRCLGNAVVPLQAKTAFEILMGLRSK